MKKILLSLFIILLTCLCINVNADSNRLVTIYVFYGNDCPHCDDLKIFLNKLEKDSKYYNKIAVQYFEVWNNKDNKYLLDELSKDFDFDSSKVPVFFVGGEMIQGFNPYKSEDKVKKLIDSKYNKDYEDPISKKIVELSEGYEKQETVESSSDDKNANEKNNNYPIALYITLVIIGLIAIIYVFMKSKEYEN